MTIPMKRSRLRRIFGFTAIALGVAFLSTAGAQAAQFHRFAKSFTLPGSVSPLEPAINQSTGEVYVSGFNAKAVYAFESDGTLEGQLTEADGTRAQHFGNPYGVAVDNSGGPTQGDIYVADFTAGIVTQFNSSGARTAEPPIKEANIPTGQPSVVNDGPLLPTGVAVASNGNVFVADQGSNVVDVFEPDGTFVSQLAAGEISGPNAIAIDPSGDLYVAQNGSGLVEFAPSGACVNSCSPIDPAANLGVATDPEGNVYGAEGGRIAEFNSSGEPIQTFGEGSLAFSRGVAFDDATGDVYVGDEGSGAVAIFEPITVASLTILPVANPTPTSGELTAEVDPAGGGNVTGCHFEYGTEKGSYNLGTLPCLSPSPADAEVGTAGNPIASSTIVHAELSGLTSETTYHYRLSVTDAQGTNEGADKTFTPLHVVGLSTDPATGVNSTGATLNGSFIGNGEATEYHFEWGTQIPYKNRTAVSTVTPSLGSKGSASFALTDLRPSTTYHYRVVATNGQGTSFGNDRILTTPATPPSIDGGSVSNVHSDSALVHAQIKPGGAVTTYHIEYGTDASYGSRAPISDAFAGSGLASQDVSVQLSDLTPATTYHWRVVARNEIETIDGPDHIFTTFPILSSLNEGCPNALSRQQTGSALLLDCRAYELVSASSTGGYNVSSDLSIGEEIPFGSYPEAESPSDPKASARVLYSINHGAIPGADHPTNKGSDPYVATRTENGWSTEYVGIPANNPFAIEPFSSIPSDAGAGLETFSFGAPGGCSPCFKEGYTGIPVRLPSGELVQGMAGSLNPGPSAAPAGRIGKDLSADGTHFVFGSKSRFEPDANEGEIAIYDRDLTTGETHVVSKTPGGETMEEEGEEIAELDISKDGSHILIGKLTGEAEGAKLYHLYMNVGDSSQTIDLTPGAAEGVRFDGMTADGTKVFFSSKEHLTGEDEQHSGADIFIWEEGQPLTLVSTGTEADASSCDPVATTLRQHWNTTGAQNCGALAIGGGGGIASGDGAVYFLSPSLLDGTEEPADGVRNAPNLYVARPGQAPHFVATLESSLTGPRQSRHPLLHSFGSFVAPEFVAADPSSGSIYVADTSINTIYKLDSTGNLISGWRENGKFALGGSPTYEPIIGLAVNPTNGNLYIDQHGQIKEFTPGGGLIASFANTSNAHGLAVDGAGDLDIFINNGFGASGILKFTSSGKEIGPVVPNVNSTGFAVDPLNGDIYVDNEGTTIERYSFNGSGEVIDDKVIASELSAAEGVAIDPAQNVYVDLGNEIREFGSSGEEVSVPFGTGLLHGSVAIAVSSTGNIYAANPSHSNLAEFGPSEPSPNLRTDNPAVVDAVSEPETRRTADFQLTPSGQFAAFSATLPLTGAESSAFPQIFRYDAAAEELDCASCNPSNAEATGPSSLATSGSSLTQAGQVFFNSEEPLALPDSDNLTDVYEWEPAGIGTCSSESPTYSKISGDCLGLVSTGTSPFNSSLLGVSLNGTDAYFFTRDSLAPQDENGELVKVYDAREGGGFFVIAEPPLCKSSDECHGAGSPPPAPPGFHRNLGEGGNEATATKCKKGFVEKHGKCTKKPKSKKHHHKRSPRRGGKK